MHHGTTERSADELLPVMASKTAPALGLRRGTGEGPIATGKEEDGGTGAHDRRDRNGGAGG